MAGKLKYDWKSVRDELPPGDGYFRAKNYRNGTKLDGAYFYAGKFYSSYSQFLANRKPVNVTHWGAKG